MLVAVQGFKVLVETDALSISGVMRAFISISKPVII